VGCLQQYTKSVLKTLFDMVLTIIKVSRLCAISYKEKVSVYCVLYIATTVLILPATELLHLFAEKHCLLLLADPQKPCVTEDTRSLVHCTNLCFHHFLEVHHALKTEI